MNEKQLITFKQAYEWENLPEPKYICFGQFPKTKEGKEFLKPFIKSGLIHEPTLKYTGVFRLTKKGINQFKQMQNEKV